jgi:uncharacterized protein (DUF1778 family)
MADIDIDMTPVGLTVPGGRNRIAKAIKTFNDTTADVANMLTECLTTARSMEASLRILDLSDEEIRDVVDAIDRRAKAQEEFLRALAGHPPA